MNLDIKLLPAQLEFMRHSNEPEWGLCCGLANGKTFAGAFWVLTRALVHKENAVCGAQTFNSTKNCLFKQMCDLLDSWGVKYDYNQTTLTITLPNGAYIMGWSGQAPNQITGLSGISNLLIDESAIFLRETKENMVTRCRGIGKDGKLIKPRLRYIGTAPLDGDTGWWRDFLTKHRDKVSFGLTKDAIGKTISQESYDRMVEQYGGEDTPIARIQLFAEVIDGVDSSCVFGPNWGNETGGEAGPISMGIDCAGAGTDSNVIIVSDRTRILEKRKIQQATGRELANIAEELFAKWNVTECRIDISGGYGNSVYECLQEDGYKWVQGINFGESASNKDVFANIRCEMYDCLSKCKMVVNDQDILEEVKYVRCFVNTRGKRCLYPKDQIKASIGRSPDSADALALACYRDDGNTVNEQELEVALSLFEL